MCGMVFEFVKDLIWDLRREQWKREQDRENKKNMFHMR
jgi:hypothetical protein